MPLVALQLLQLTAHREQPLLGILRRFVGRADVLARDGVEVRLDLMQLGGDGGVALDELVDLALALLDQQADFLRLVAHLGQLGARRSR